MSSSAIDKYTITYATPPSQSMPAARTALWQTWLDWLSDVVDALAALMPSGAGYILIDDGVFGSELLPRRKGVQFDPRDAVYYGALADASEALSIFETLRSDRVGYLVILWPAFWWMDYYVGFREHLEREYSCVMRDELAVAFALGNGNISAAGCIA